MGKLGGVSKSNKALESFTYLENNKKKSINVRICKTFWEKGSGLMFRKTSPPLLFIFPHEKTLTIHSFFCKPFEAIWLDKNKKVTKQIYVDRWLPKISGNGKYLLEIPIK